jgi:hypothetical protein
MEREVGAKTSYRGFEHQNGRAQSSFLSCRFGRNFVTVMDLFGQEG